MDTTNVAIIGLGTVGSGLAKILLQHNDRVTRHAGRAVRLDHVVVRDPQKPRQCEVPAKLLTTDLQRILRDDSVKVVAQLIGGVEPAREIMLRLLESGKDVVTANKALIAEHGADLFGRARELGRAIAFEASVAGGIPVITNISQCLSGNQITSLRGILNGTSNFIASQMEESDWSYGDALREARRRGYAEADPSMDVDGSDAAQKLAILAHLAFGAHVRWNEIPRIGIESLLKIDMRCAADLGYRIKLLAVARLRGNELELHVSPNLVRVGTPLAEVRQAYNAISVVGDAVGTVFYHGSGAGQMPTASAVAADLIDMVVGRAQITFRTLELWSGHTPRVGLTDHGSATSRYYLRFMAEDRPGVVAELATVLGNHDISIASMIQHEADEEAEPTGATPVVPLVMMTHLANVGAVTDALRKIDQLDAVRGQSVQMRVLD